MKRRNGIGAIARTFAITTLLVAGLASLTVRDAEANFTCNEDVFFTTIRGNVTVPANGTCNLYGVIVTGSVSVNQGGYFFAESNSGVRAEIRGNVSASGAETVGIFDMTVRGSVSVENTNYGAYGFSEIRGNLTVSGGIETFYVDRNTIRGSLVLTNNLNEEPSQGNEVTGNIIRGSVTCSGNAGLVFTGNQVRGSVSDECVA